MELYLRGGLIHKCIYVRPRNASRVDLVTSCHGEMAARWHCQRDRRKHIAHPVQMCRSWPAPVRYCAFYNWMKGGGSVDCRLCCLWLVSISAIL